MLLLLLLLAQVVLGAMAYTQRSAVSGARCGAGPVGHSAVGLCGSLWGPYGSLWVTVHSYGVSVCHCGVPMGPCGSL